MKLTLNKPAELVIKKLGLKIKFSQSKDLLSPRRTKTSSTRKILRTLSIWTLEPRLLRIRLDQEKYVEILLQINSMGVDKAQEQI